MKPNLGQSWATQIGNFQTKEIYKIIFILPKFHKNRKIKWEMHIDDSNSKENTYDLLIGRNFMHELGFNMDFQKERLVWNNTLVNIQDSDHSRNGDIENFEGEIFLMHDHETTEDRETTEAERIQRISNVNYSKADLTADVKKFKKSVENKKVIKKFSTLFDCTLGDWKTTQVDLELKDPQSKPVYQKLYPVPISSAKDSVI